jgi:uncharacterized protein
LSLLIDLDDKLIKSIKTLGEKYGVDKIVLFGSRARGDNSKLSDIDLAIYTSGVFKKKGKLASEIDDLDTLLKIDTVFVSENADMDLLENIDREGVVIYENK